MQKKKIKFHILRFCPTFDSLYLNAYLVQKCKKKKYLCCNLFWVPMQFDWTSLFGAVKIDQSGCPYRATPLGAV